MELVEQLHKLWELKQSGALTNEEFSIAKLKILDINKSNTVSKSNIVEQSNAVSKLDTIKSDNISYNENYFSSNLLWSDQNNISLIDYRGDKYHFGEPWKNSKYIRVIYKNGCVLREHAGIQRGYLLWLDSNNIIHIAHGHQNIDKISHSIIDNPPGDKPWGCSWGNKLDRHAKNIIYNHFNISI